RRPILEALIQVDIALEWKQGRQVRVESYLQRFPELGSPDTVSPQLIFAELAARRASTGEPALASYRERFPAQFDKVVELMEQDDNPSTPTYLGPGAAPATEGHPIAVGGYEILRRLAHGAFGSVYLARSKYLDRTVALKMVQPRDARMAQL